MTSDVGQSLLVVGGSDDPNISALLDASERASIATNAVLVGAASDPSMHWDFDRDVLEIDGAIVAPTMAFVRHDVFAGMRDSRPETAARALAWFSALAGWLDAHPTVRCFNRQSRGVPFKVATLALARASGLEIPKTVVSNSRSRIEACIPIAEGIAKPVAGGGLCVPLAEAMGSAETRGDALSSPAILQERLVPPELRIYVVGTSLHAFRVESPELDYRRSQSAVVVSAEVPSQVSRPLLALAERLGLDFAAADFKTCPQTGSLLFLEINTGPMFAAFDRASDGRLTQAMIGELAGAFARS